ncbi:MAG: helix-turn-helix transcriptional regulator [Oscillospiraceae bacterium]|nr:helix-turn-helix transcriptional regulator [Oscillospiraceae bacterium]
MNEILGNNIMTLRKANGLTQEQLASALGISFQAVSKWETGNSCPDISTLPLLADLFSVSVDQLIGRVPLMGLPEEEKQQAPEAEPADAPDAEPGPVLSLPWPDDDSFYMVLFHGHTLIGSQEEREKKTCFEFQYEGPAQNIFSDFSVQVDGDVEGSVKAGAEVRCGDVGGKVDAETGVDCGDVGGSVKAGGGVNCGDVGGSVSAGGSVNCGDVGGGVNAGGNVDCGDVGGDVSAGASVDCNDVGKNVYAGTRVDCDSVNGTVIAGGSSPRKKGVNRRDNEDDFDLELDEMIDRQVEDSVRFGQDLGQRISDAVQKAIDGKFRFRRQEKNPEEQDEE